MKKEAGPTRKVASYLNSLHFWRTFLTRKNYLFKYLKSSVLLNSHRNTVNCTRVYNYINYGMCPKINWVSMASNKHMSKNASFLIYGMLKVQLDKRILFHYIRTIQRKFDVLVKLIFCNNLTSQKFFYRRGIDRWRVHR